MRTPVAPRLFDRLRDKIRLKHYSVRTEQPYTDWIKRFIRFNGKRPLKQNIGPTHSIHRHHAGNRGQEI